MHILVITPPYFPDFGASAIIYTELTKNLVKLGFKVTVITGFPHYGRDKIPVKYKGKLFVKEVI